MSDLFQRIASLSPAKREILLKRIKSRNGPRERAQAIPRRPSPGAAAPLSFAQQRIWFLDQLDPGNPAFNVPTPVEIKGRLKTITLTQAFNEIIRRHESLKTVFRMQEEQPVQVINRSLTVIPAIVDLSGLSKESLEREAGRLAGIEQYRSFCLSEGPLLRITLVRSAIDEHALLLTMHHIISDGWSTGVLVREFASLYGSYSGGQPSPLPELVIQYADFACWQRDASRAGDHDRQLDYWKRRLEGAPQITTLAPDYPRPPVQSFRGARQSFLLPASLSTVLAELAQREQATLFMVLLAAFQVMLSRSTGQTDIVVGTDIANRNRTEVEPLIGFFINHVVLRADLFRNPTFRELLGEVRRATIEAYANQDLPFERIVEALQPGRDPSRNPLFQVLFVLQNAPRAAVEIEGIVLRLKEVENRSAKFDIALFLEETEQGLFGVWNYNTDLFKETTINRLTMQLEKLLRNIAANPDARVSTYDMLSESEKLQQTARKQRRKQARLKMLLDAAPEAVSLPRESLVRIDSLAPEQSLPVVIQPEVNDLDLIDWARSERAFIEASLLKSGAILFRGFGIDSLTRFEQFAQAACPRLFGDYGDLPREEMGGKIYGSTPYPAEKAILFHNESSHTHQWPMKIFFHCRKAAEQGGETPIVDCRRVYQRLDPEIRERFEKKRLLYVRNFTDGLDVSWQDFFRTSDRAAVEEYCMRNSIQFEWKANNGLRTRQQGIAVAKHPKTGERIFFNQIQLHHIGFLSPEVRSSLVSLFEEENLPRHVYHGDGSPIEKEVIQQIRKVYEECAVEFRWQEGDVMMLDNMLAAHARNPYVGRRKIVVAMGEMINSKELEQEGI